MAKLVVIGALALDRPIRLSGALAPGARLMGRTLDGTLGGRLGGGGANAGAALTRAGHEVRLVAMTAVDHDGEAALALAQAAGLDVSLVQRRPGTSGATIILIDPTGERVVLRLDPEYPSLPRLAEPPAAPMDGLFVRAPYPGAVAWADACQGPVVVQWPCPGFAGPCDVLVASADDCDAATLADSLAVGRAQVGDRLAAFVVTHGAGPVLAYRDLDRLEVLPEPVAAVDSTGAGDVFAAGLLDALTAGAGLEAAITHAATWGAVAVGLENSAPTTGAFAPFRPAAA
jgi:sugar/nucleoside kinase (ribokinase family)